MIHNTKAVYKVLIVDDSPYNLFVIKKLLAQMESIERIEKAMNGQEALQKIVENECCYDIIFLDLHMPILDGFQTIKQLYEMNEEKVIEIG